MRIKSPDTNVPWQREWLERLVSRRAGRVAVILVYGLITLAFGVFLQRSGLVNRAQRIGADTLRILEKQNVRFIGKVASGALAKPERLYIHLKFENFQLLEAQRDRALATGVLTVSNEDYVPASLEHAGNTYRVRIRLKGDLTDHLDQGDKWSFRIRVRGENTFWGMKQFSLHHPNTRNYVYEWLFHRMLLREDVIGLRYDFIRVYLNGRDLGVYAIEEHFEKRLVEYNHRREGPIIRFAEDRLWEEWRQQKIPFSGARQSGGGSYLASEIDAFQSQRWASTPQSREVYERAVDLLESFRRGETRTSDTFDVKRLATFFAITDLAGAEHGARWHNTRFYYNPVTSRLEPIGFDGDSGRQITQLLYHMKDEHWSKNAWSSDPLYYRTVFADPAFVEEYLAALHRVSQQAYLDTFFADIRDELEQKLRTIYTEDPSFDFSKEILYRNQRYIRSTLAPAVAVAAHYPKGSVGGDDGALVLRVGNLQALPIEIVGMTAGETEMVPDESLLLAGRLPNELVEYRDLHFSKALDVARGERTETHLRYKISGIDQIHETLVTPWPYSKATDPNADVLRRKPNTASFDFVVVDESKRTLTVKPGTWTVSEDLIVPAGYLLRCGPGTHLQLESSALMLSYSRIEFIGTSDEPIVISSPDQTGQGLLVMGVEAESILEHVLFEKLTNPSRHGWSLTGAVTFHESAVTIQNVRFVENHAEDALNLIRSRFRIFDSYFGMTQSDAFDADFCVGEVRRSVFDRCGNDGIDVSGSNVEVSGVHVMFAGDKGISVGENSRLVATDVTVERSRVGIAVKDYSFVDGQQIRISDTTIGCAAYQKKPEFGPATARFGELEMRSVDSTYFLERGCVVEANGTEIVGHEQGVARRLESQQAENSTRSTPVSTSGP